MAITHWVLFSLTHHFYLGKHPVILRSEIISVSNSLMETKIQLFYSQFLPKNSQEHNNIQKTTYPNDYFIFQSFHWFSSISSCRFWNLFHVINYAPNEVVMKSHVGGRKGKESVSSFTIDFLSFILIYHSYPSYRKCICRSDKKSLKKKKKSSQQNEIQNLTTHPMKFRWEFYKMG